MHLIEHLHSREFDTSLHAAWTDSQDECVTFPLWNLSGQMVGYQQYRPNASKEKKNHPREGRYFTHVKGGRVGVWGLESWHLTPGHLFITEGVFDACRLTARGYSAVALLSHKPNPSTVRWLVTLCRFLTAVCDDDPGGAKMATLGHRSITTPGGDLGDMSGDWVTNLLGTVDSFPSRPYNKGIG